MPEQNDARLTVNEGGVERDEEADWGEKHLNGPNEVLLRQFFQRNIPLLVLRQDV